ncbi:hypothetical protein GCM10010909_12900 [Acidocella aquatica]|uniref:Uncharacterized protein n=1 Tax=Acidocella aquatica TaxID=1922313 RepID=A0ABQ6A2B0_9PROT|nr:hypothetical protein [Acidocella aquatica]GLR66610.1 hypothetical protein GCM10010909_12900 [Acidocella aquatica]
MSSAIEQLRGAVDRLRQAGRAEGIEVDGPLGQWLEAQTQALLGLGDILQGQDGRVDLVLGRIESSAGLELRNLHEAIEGANHVVRQGDFALRQARQMQAGLVVEREHMVQKMVDETLPMFADKLNGALVIREEAWNAKARDRRYAIAAAISVALMLVGYCLSWWQDSGQVAAFNRCLTHPVQFEGQLYCPAAGLLTAATVAGGSGGS